MTPKDVRAEVESIEKMKGDSECAHCAEDELHQAVLQAIADGSAVDPRECARLALMTAQIRFSRWYA